MTMTELQSGQRFRGLSIQGLLGKNASEAVYLASHPVLAVPLVIETFAEVDEQRFQYARLLARVSSPRLIGMIDAGEEQGMAFTVRLLVDGISLAELLSYFEGSRRGVPVQQLIPLVSDVAKGLQDLHIAGGVHRGLRPSSIFLAGDGRALVGDPVSVRAPLNHAPPLVRDDPSSAFFKAPELWRDEPHRASADIYALGATAHYLATGIPPFPGDEDDQERAHTHDVYVSPSITRPEAAYFFALISSMLAKDPLDRPESAGEIARLLSRVTPESPELRITSDTTAELGNMYIEIYAGDIAQAEADVIVNAATPDMAMDTGVGEALRHMGGEAIRQEARAQGLARLGDVVWTGAGRLQGCWVAHAIASLEGVLCIQRCTLRTLLEAQARGARSVVFPALGTGRHGVSMELAAKLMLEAIMTFARLDSEPVDQVAIALRDDLALEQWSSVLRSLGSMR